jgi:hypothetical protein
MTLALGTEAMLPWWAYLLMVGLFTLWWVVCWDDD